MTFSAGRQRRVASPFAQRAAESAKARETPDISTIPDPFEAKPEPEVAEAPEIVEEEVEAAVESNNQEVANDASDEAQEPISEAEAAEVPAEADEPAAKPTRGRGRPRPAEVQERDARVEDFVTTSPGQTRGQLEEGLGLTSNEVYMSLYRLRTQGKIERRREAGDHKWYAKPTQ